MVEDQQPDWLKAYGQRAIERAGGLDRLKKLNRKRNKKVCKGKKRVGK